AVAHVGIELLLDGALSELAPDSIGAYEGALRAGSALNAEIDWPVLGQSFGFALLCRALRKRPPTLADIEPEVLAERLDRLLSGRPRLSLSAGDLARVAFWCGGAKGGVFVAAEGLLSELLRTLAPARRGSNAATA
ncbi:MAG TPA: hypothetical protein VF989_04245, partial [Polyangiaceae bacterium]